MFNSIKEIARSAVARGKKGGKVKSEKKARSSAANGALGDRPAGVFSKKTIESVPLGFRKLNGTNWPIENILYRCTTPSGRVSWQIVYSLCNGVPLNSETFKLKREALRALKPY